MISFFWIVSTLNFAAFQFSYSQATQNFVIRGTVTDQETGESLPGVNVYLSETSIGTTSDSKGIFELTTNVTGSFKVVASFVGYQSETEQIYLRETGFEEPIELEFTLARSSPELDELEVKASNSEWQNYFNEFREYFLGPSSYADETIIENAWSIDFEIDDEENLIASIHEPLVVTNYALGYKIEIDLVEFKWNRNRNTGLYVLHTRFNKLDPKDSDQLEEWQKNRRNAYLGSFEHFLRSLYNDNLTANRFEPVLKDSQNRIQIAEYVSNNSEGMNIHTSTPGVENENTKTFVLRGPTDILYGTDSGYSNGDERIRSRIVPMNNSGVFVVTEQGRLANPSSLRVDGAWSYDRVAELLPVTYSPEE